MAQIGLAEEGVLPLLGLSPVMIGGLLTIRAYLCIAAGRAGQLVRSRALLAGVERFLIVHDEVTLLRDCRLAAQQPPA